MKALISVLFVYYCCFVTAQAGVTVIGSLARNHTADPGAGFEGIILLKNTTRTPANVRVYQTDYLFFANGTNLYSQPGSHPRSNADWISVSPTRFTIPAGETYSVHYKGKVPAAPDLLGTYWSMIMVEPSAPPAPVANGKEKEAALGLQTLIRFGIQVVTDVGGSRNNSVKINRKQLLRDAEKKALLLDLENTGQRLIVPTLWVELFNQQGQSIGKFEGGRARIFPACSVRFQADLSDVPAGKYSALVIADTGGDDVMGAQYELDLEK